MTKIAKTYVSTPPLVIQLVIDLIDFQSSASGVHYLGITGEASTSSVSVPLPLKDPLAVFHAQNVDAHQQEAGIAPFVQKFKDIFQAPDGSSDDWGTDDSRAKRSSRNTPRSLQRMILPRAAHCGNIG